MLLPGFPPRKNTLVADIPIDQLPCVIIDFETTGLFPHHDDQIIELGAVVMEGLTLHEHDLFDCLVDPQRPVSEDAFRVHGISNETLVGRPTIDSVLPPFITFLGKRIIVGQNIAFDLGFLVRALDRCRLPLISNLVLDTRWLSQILYPATRHHSLDAIASRLKIRRPADRHRARGDVLLTAKILIQLLKICRHRGFNTLGEILDAYQTAEGGRYGGPDVSRILEYSFERRQMVEIQYLQKDMQDSSSVASLPTRPVSIYHLSHPYFLAYCHTRHAIRTFRVDRVIWASPLEDHYEIPVEFQPHDHFLRSSSS